jgi:hypothetical protein
MHLIRGRLRSRYSNTQDDSVPDGMHLIDYALFNITLDKTSEKQVELLTYVVLN